MCAPLPPAGAETSFGKEDEDEDDGEEAEGLPVGELGSLLAAGPARSAAAAAAAAESASFLAAAAVVASATEDVEPGPP